jgi:hypothetical protein
LAVRLSVPVGRVVTVRVAVPLARVPVPRVVVPSRKVTVPVGTELEDGAATVAVSVTVWPLVAGFGDAERVVVVATGPGVGPPPELEPPHPARRVEVRSSRQAGRARRIGWGSFKTL